MVEKRYYWLKIKEDFFNDIRMKRLKKISAGSTYDMWDTKAIIFCFENHELSFVRQDCWFSQEIEIYKGQSLLAKTGDAMVYWIISMKMKKRGLLLT